MKNRLRVLRAERNWSQQKLADELNVSRQTINAIEKGKFDPSLPLAFKAARLFGMSIEEIGRHIVAASDVFPEEPMPNAHRVRSLDGFIRSAHRAGALVELEDGALGLEEAVEEAVVEAVAEEALAEAAAEEAGEEEAPTFPTAIAATERRGPVTTVE